MSPRSDPKARALEVCLQSIQAGVNPEQALTAYPRYADELRPLIWASLSIRPHAEAIQIPVLHQENSLGGFLQISQRMLPRKERTWLAGLVRAILIILVGLVLLSSAAWAAETLSRPALPGSLVHPVKLACEQIRLSLTRVPIRRLALELANDQERLSETQTLIQRSLTAEVILVGSLSQMSGDEWLVQNIRVQIRTDARFMGDIEPGYAILIEGELQSDGSILAHNLRMREYTLSGAIQSITEDQLLLAGIPIWLTPQTLIMGIPAPGNQAQVILRRAADGQLHARLVEILP